jgi:hypothetical protein
MGRFKHFYFRKDIEPVVWVAMRQVRMILRDQQIAGKDDPFCGQVQECVTFGLF